MSKPVFENAPGLTLRYRSGRWEARWRARRDLVLKGYTPKIQSLWSGTEPPSDVERAFVSDRCSSLQSEMLVWGRGGIPAIAVFDGTLRTLIACYQTDSDSPYHSKRYKSRKGYDYFLSRMVRDTWTTASGEIRVIGEERISDIRARTIKRWYEVWLGDGRVTMAHSMMRMLRMVLGFGMSILEDDDCARLKVIMREMRFKTAKPRNEQITSEQAAAVCRQAHVMGLPSIALAQAFQFEATLRQKDVIGEWVPLSEPEMSLVTHDNMKWLRGLRWSEIDPNLILRHTTSKRDKDIEVNLRFAPLVLEQLSLVYGLNLADELIGIKLPINGPVIVSEKTGQPYKEEYFQKTWRKVATAAGVPRHVFNMDTRAGAITEATDAGARIEDVRHAATHTDISMTQRYSRGSTEKVAGVMQLRAEYRNKKRT